MGHHWERSLSAEAAQARESEATLVQLNGMLDAELADLTAQIATARARSTSDGSATQALHDEQKVLAERRARVAKAVADLEATLRTLQPRLPKPLQDKIAAVWTPASASEAGGGLADETDADHPPLGERMRAALAALAEVQKFDREVVVTAELRDLDRGGRGEARVMYLGLGVGYYVTADGTAAGRGYPTATGWQWDAHPEWAEAIQDALAGHDGLGSDVRFVGLPLAPLPETSR